MVMCWKVDGQATVKSMSQTCELKLVHHPLDTLDRRPPNIQLKYPSGIKCLTVPG